MKYFVGIFRLLFGIGAMVIGSVGLNQHFGGYEKDKARLAGCRPSSCAEGIRLCLNARIQMNKEQGARNFEVRSYGLSVSRQYLLTSLVPVPYSLFTRPVTRPFIFKHISILESFHIKPIQIHHPGPGSHKVFHKFIL